MRIPYRKPGKYSLIKPDLMITTEKFKQLSHKLQKMKDNHPQAVSEVKRLAELGDFSENAEYQLAKGHLRGLNQRILNLQNFLDHAVIITPQKTDTIQIGHTVTITDGKKEKTYQILGSSETNLIKGIISHLSPIGAALLGKKTNEEVEIELTNKKIKYKIIKIK